MERRSLSFPVPSLSSSWGERLIPGGFRLMLNFSGISHPSVGTSRGLEVGSLAVCGHQTGWCRPRPLGPRGELVRRELGRGGL